MTDNTVKFGNSFYLKHETGQYLVAVDRGRYKWSQLGNTGKDVDVDKLPNKLKTDSKLKPYKRDSPHIEHFDSGINGYAIAEFTPDKLTWCVYEVNTTEYDKLPDGRNVSSNRVKRKLVQSATYNPNKIKLND